MSDFCPNVLCSCILCVLWFTGIIAAVALTVHVLYRRDFWTYGAHASLTRLMYTGCFVQLAGVVGFIVYLIFGSMHQTGKFYIILPWQCHFYSEILFMFM